MQILVILPGVLTVIAGIYKQMTKLSIGYLLVRIPGYFIVVPGFFIIVPGILWP